MNINQADNDQRENAKISKSIIKKGLGRTLVVWFLSLALIPMSVVGIISYQNAYKSLYDGAVTALRSAANLKTEQIDFYFSEMLTGMRLQSEMRTNMYFLEELISDFKSSGMSIDAYTTSLRWTIVADEKGSDLITYRRIFGYHDILLIDSTGNVLFSVAREDELGTNLFDGKYSNTLFAAACQRSLETGEPAFSDYEANTYSEVDEVYGFITAVIVNDNGEKIGLIAFQFPVRQIDRIMQKEIYLGKTAETYLIGLDLKMRSNSIRVREKTVLKYKVETEEALLWKKQTREGIDVQEMFQTAKIYNGPHGGKPVLGIHSNINIAGVPFGVIAEIEQGEAFAPSGRLRNIVYGLLVVTGLLVVFIAVVVSRRIVHPIKALSAGAKQVAGGQLDQDIEIKSGNEIGELADSFNDMLVKLRRTMEENEAQNRLKTGQMDLSEEMRGEQDIGTLGGKIIHYLTEYLNAQIGAIYMANDDSRLKLIGSYAWNRRKNLSNEFMPGEGIVGQAALEKKHILISNCPDDYIRVYSGLGEAVPNNILVFPLLLDNTVKGIVELGSLK